MINNIRKILNKIYESSIDFPRETLPKSVWYYDEGRYKLKKDVKDRILKALSEYPAFNILSIAREIKIVGSMGSNLYAEDTDIDIHIIPDIKALKGIDLPKLQHDIFSFYKENRDKNNWYAEKHPFEVYLQLDPIQDLMSIAVYDIIDDKWIKQPKLKKLNYNPYEIFKDVYDNIKDLVKGSDIKITELRRDLIDYKTIIEAIENLPNKYRESLKDDLENKIKELEEGIMSLFSDRESWREMRREFSKTPDRFKSLKDLELPDKWQKANASFKFLDRYLYLKLTSDLNKLISDGSLDDNDIESLERILKEFMDLK